MPSVNIAQQSREERERPRQGCIIITVAKPLPLDPPSPSAWGADQDQLGDRQEFNLQILDILPLP